MSNYLLDLFLRPRTPAVIVPEGLTVPHFVPLNIRTLDAYGQWYYRGTDWTTDGSVAYGMFFANPEMKPSWHLMPPGQAYAGGQNVHCIEWVPWVSPDDRYIVTTPEIKPPNHFEVREWTLLDGAPGWHAFSCIPGKTYVGGHIPDGSIFIAGFFVGSIPAADAQALVDYLRKRDENMALGKQLAADMGRPYNMAYLIPPDDIVDIVDNLRADAAAKAKRDRKAAKREENNRRAAAGKIRA